MQRGSPGEARDALGDGRPLSADDRFTIPETVRATLLDDDIVLLDLRAGEYFSLNASGALLWKAIEGGGDLGAALSASEHWPLPPAERHSVVLALIGDLLARGLLVRQAPADPA